MAEIYLKPDSKEKFEGSGIWTRSSDEKEIISQFMFEVRKLRARL